MDVFPTLKRFRKIDIVTYDEKLAVEVKTYGGHSIQSSGDTLEEHLVDFLRWRTASRGRKLVLAIVHDFGVTVISSPDLHFIIVDRIPVFGFVIQGMLSKYDAV